MKIKLFHLLFCILLLGCLSSLFGQIRVSSLENSYWKIEETVDYFISPGERIRWIEINLKNDNLVSIKAYYILDSINPGMMPVPFTKESNGSYSVNNKIITLKLPNYIVEAEINDKEMKGILTENGTNRKYRWNALKFEKAESGNSKKTQPIDTSGLETRIRNQNTKVTFAEIEQSYKNNLFDEVIEKSKMFLKTEPENAKINLYLGVSLLIKKQIDDGVLYLHKSLDLGETISLTIKTVRQRGILKVFFVNYGEFVISKDGFGIKEPDKVFVANFSSLTTNRLDNYQNQCPVAYLEGQFSEIKPNSNKTKQEFKTFNLFPDTTTLQTVSQYNPITKNNVDVNVITCNDEGIIPIAIVKLLNRLK